MAYFNAIHLFINTLGVVKYGDCCNLLIAVCVTFETRKASVECWLKFGLCQCQNCEHASPSFFLVCVQLELNGSVVWQVRQ